MILFLVCPSWLAGTHHMVLHSIWSYHLSCQRLKEASLYPQTDYSKSDYSLLCIYSPLRSLSVSHTYTHARTPGHHECFNRPELKPSRVQLRAKRKENFTSVLHLILFLCIKTADFTFHLLNVRKSLFLFVSFVFLALSARLTPDSSKPHTHHHPVTI